MNKDNKEECNMMCNCLYFTSNKLNRIINRIADEEFLKTGLSTSHALTLLNIINQPGISQKDLSRDMTIKPSTTTRFIDKLESKGLVERKAVGKISYLYSTDKGTEMKDEISESWGNLYQRYSKILGEEKGIKLTAEVNKAAIELEKNLN
jgi:DNA-binding MarR family transcriptional regulator